MTFTPIFLAVLALLGLAQQNSLLLGWSVGFLIIFALTYWLINIIWAIVSVINYNSEIEDEAKRQLDLWNRHNQGKPNQIVLNINQNTSDLPTSGRETIEVSIKPNLQDWLKSNPGKSINDYFTKYGR